MIKQKSTLLITICFALLFIASCGQNNDEPTPAPTAELVPTATQVAQPTEPAPEPEPTATVQLANPNPKTVLISHVLAGIQGNNNYDYIALYNNRDGFVDLDGYTLTYQARPDDEPEVLITWTDKTPFVGEFFLLGRTGESYDQPLDGTFDLQIFNRGSLTLLDRDQRVVDMVGWGDMPEGSYSGAPAPKIPRGMTLVRQLEPPFANDSTSNADLFTAQDTPKISVCSDANSPVRLSIDPIINPGQSFEVKVDLITPEAFNNVKLLVPAGFSIPRDDGTFWELESADYVGLNPPFKESQTIELIAPTTLQAVTLRGGEALVNDQIVCIPTTNFVVEGILPIGLARTFIDQTVTVEGIATMYTDGFFAGSSGTKFYIEDETGGVQIFVPGGKGGVRIGLGDRVRVTGKTELYRTALEVIPADFDANIEIIEKAADMLEATAADLAAIANDESLLGQLVATDGTISRVEEFTFSYELDLTNEAGDQVLVYIDKLTELSVETIDVGQEINISGIVESWDGRIRLNPRVQTDLARIWPEVLLVEVNAPAAVSVSPVDYEIQLTNHTSETQTNILVTAPRPEGAIETIIIDTGVTATRDIVNWLIPEMEPSEAITLNMTVNLSASSNNSVDGPADRIFFFPVKVTSDQQDQVESADLTVYTGGILPIWAIQGSDSKSPYVGRTETTSGIITGIFPELEGFFLQSQNNDQNVSTSNGIFVHVTDGAMPEDIALGMLVNVTGKISENSGQTEIQVETEAEESGAITIISTTNLLETIEPVQLIPPTQIGMLDYFEAREGMLVTLDGYAVAVGPANRFGEFPLYPISLSENLEPELPLIYRTGDTTLSDGIIFVDDGSDAEYATGNELPLAIATGDIVSNVTGPLAFTFGNYKIEPLNTADIAIEPSTYAEHSVEAIETSRSTEIAIASFNVENFFDPFDPHPSSPPLPGLDEYRQKLAKLAAGFKLMGYPEIVGLQEVENLKVLEDLAEQIAADGGPIYQAHLIEGSDGRGIDVAYMTNERVTLVSLEQRPAPEGITSREPLLMVVRVQVGDAGQEQTIALINNHFTSLAGGEEASLPRRLAQAEWNAGLVAEVIATSPQDTHVVVLGDLNSFRATPPLDALEAELNHIYTKIEAEGANVPYAPYTYIFEGVAQSLDHILVSDGLFEALTDVIALPISADYSLPFEGDTSAYRASDHNPLIAIFEFEAE
ncbi:MAG: endonuclease/exonuclease/phosphatase family protein [Anaerolineae bacterium]